MANQIDPERLRALTEKILQTVLQPALLDQLQETLKAPPGEFFVEASKRLTPSALRAAGIEIPNGVRISSRYFEDGTVTSSAMADTEAGETIVTSIKSRFPGPLDQLKKENPNAYRRLVEKATAGAAAGGCVGVGVPPGVCACVGG